MKSEYKTCSQQIDSELKMLLQKIYPTTLCQSGRGAFLHGMHGYRRGTQLMWLLEKILQPTSRNPEQKDNSKQV